MAKTALLITTGGIGGTIAYLLGGWDTAIETLVIFMAIDYITGLMVAGVFQKSKKTETGGLSSKAGWRGLCRKCVTLFYILVAVRLDMYMGTDFLRNAIIVGFIANETLSIAENAGLMGVNFPEPIKKALDVLMKK